MAATIYLSRAPVSTFAAVAFETYGHYSILYIIHNDQPLSYEIL